MNRPPRNVTTEFERKQLLKFLEQQKLPFSVEIVAGRRRTVEQNRLQRLWMREVSDQLGDRSPEEVRGYCKLHFGVPLLREEHAGFRVKYDQIVKPLAYPQKLEIMMEPLDLPVTRLMTTAQKTTYLDTVFRHFSEMGLVLTIPPDKWRAAA